MFPANTLYSISVTILTLNILLIFYVVGGKPILKFPNEIWEQFVSAFVGDRRNTKKCMMSKLLREMTSIAQNKLYIFCNSLVPLVITSAYRITSVVEIFTFLHQVLSWHE